MNRYVAAYLATAIVFAVLDLAWLSSVGASLFRRVLGDILLDNVRLAPAGAFYAMFPAGIVLFAVAPAFAADRRTTALVLGALFGMFCYATYDLTNQATLRAWTTTLTLVDVGWGALLTGFSAAAGYAVIKALLGPAVPSP